ncbi:MAG: AMP-binding protein, partial [Mariprofundaceae bacterium]|nr:AMP-binding protein [Mariprofundaceae bacterium]
MKLLMFILRYTLKFIYRVHITGLEHVHSAGERVLIVANHTSFLDAVLLALFLPTNISFAIHSSYYNKWWMRPVKSVIPLFAVDHSDPMAMKSLIKHVKAGHKVVIFPEGRITATGSLMKIYPGPGMVADKADASILPICIHGAQFTPFSRLKGQVRLRWFPRITLTVLPPQKMQFDAEMKGRERREKAGKVLADIMQNMVFATSPYQQRLWDSLLEAAAIHGKNHLILEDIERQSISYHDLFTRSMVLQQLLPSCIESGDRVGLLLPNMNSCAITLFALHARAAVPAMLNYSMGEKATLAALQSATIRTVLTSRRFVEAAHLEELITSMQDVTHIVYLEDLREKLTILHKVKGFMLAKIPFLGIQRLIRHVKADDAAVVLFTSGSEGTPKGVVLSHQNILANVEQISASIAFNTQDVCLNALPMFHSFGFTAGTILPLMRGIKTFLYPSPLHYKVIPEVAYDINATILFGTNVFLAAYAKHAHPYDFYSMRYVVAGAEKLQAETRQAWMHKFGIRILEGYGATETSPVLACNSPMHFKAGSVGRLLPSIEHRLEPVQGIEDAGRLWVRGANVMKGYLLHDKPGLLQKPQDGWYDTGDIVSIDADGFVHIQGRAKRFAKIAGEMVSLTAVETMAKRCWADFEHVALAFPDPNKGEQLVLLTTLEKAPR